MAVADKRAFNTEGSLYELVNRGRKDAFFYKDSFDETVSQFDTRYEHMPPVIHERRTTVSRNAVAFGQTVEFELEVAGDVVLEPTFSVQMPTWIPDRFVAVNRTGAEIGGVFVNTVADASGTRYGWTNGVGYFLFRNIQVFQDNLLLQEFSGDALYATRRSRGSLNSAGLELRQAGFVADTPLARQRAATPGLLRIQLPLIGCQTREEGGFPSIAVRQQTYRIRATLRSAEDLIAATSDSRQLPFERTFSVKTPSGTVVDSFVAPPRSALTPPVIQLETRHMYVDGESQRAVRDVKHVIPFSRLYENTFTFGPADYAPLQKGATSLTTRRLDAVHPASRIVWYMRRREDVEANRYDTFDVSGADYYTSVSLVIAGRERESAWPALVWNTLSAFAKEDRDPGAGLSIMNWDLGDARARPTRRRVPEGSVNFTTADRPTFLISLSDAGLGSNLNYATMNAIVDTWTLFTIDSSRGGLNNWI